MVVMWRADQVGTTELRTFDNDRSGCRHLVRTHSHSGTSYGIGERQIDYVCSRMRTSAASVMMRSINSAQLGKSLMTPAT